MGKMKALRSSLNFKEEKNDWDMGVSHLTSFRQKDLDEAKV
jgi:hypothetical protein